MMNFSCNIPANAIIRHENTECLCLEEKGAARVEIKWKVNTEIHFVTLEIADLESFIDGLIEIARDIDFEGAGNQRKAVAVLRAREIVKDAC